MNAIGSLLILIVTLLVCAEVVHRNVKGEALPGVTEMVAFSVVMIVFLQLASALRHDRFARADIFIEPLTKRHPRLAGCFLMFHDLLGVGVAAIICYGSWPLLRRAWTQELFFGIPGVFTAPEWPMRAAVVIGSAALCLQFLMHAFSRSHQIIHPRSSS